MKAYDFTQGNVLKQLVLFSMPIMLGNALQVSFQFIDSLWIGNLLGAKALGGDRGIKHDCFDHAVFYFGP